MIKEFYEFLDLRGHLLKFLDTLEPWVSLYDVIPTLYVGAIYWDDTEEGGCLWEVVEEEWINYLEYWEEDLGENWYLNEKYKDKK